MVVCPGLEVGDLPPMFVAVNGIHPPRIKQIDDAGERLLNMIGAVMVCSFALLPGVWHAAAQDKNGGVTPTHRADGVGLVLTDRQNEVVFAEVKRPDETRHMTICFNATFPKFLLGKFGHGLASGRFEKAGAFHGNVRKAYDFI